MIIFVIAMNKKNYQAELDRIIKENSEKGITPSLLLHACCAPCSSYCLEYLSKYFNITVLYYNPNISIKEEYEYRLSEEKRLISKMNFENPVKIIEGRYMPDEFFNAVRGLENEPEGGKRCEECFRLRLNETEQIAEKLCFDYYCTTLSISPLKNAALLNEIGAKLAQNSEVKWLASDFKKREGYKRSVELSKQLGLYRQNYCGCVFSRNNTVNNNG